MDSLSLFHRVFVAVFSGLIVGKVAFLQKIISIKHQTLRFGLLKDQRVQTNIKACFNKEVTSGTVTPRG